MQSWGGNKGKAQRRLPMKVDSTPAQSIPPQPFPPRRLSATTSSVLSTPFLQGFKSTVQSVSAKGHPVESIYRARTVAAAPNRLPTTTSPSLARHCHSISDHCYVPLHCCRTPPRTIGLVSGTLTPLSRCLLY